MGWQRAHTAKVMDQYQKVPGLLELDRVRDFTLYRITLRKSPNHHVAVRRYNRNTAWGVKVMAPETARNTDGIIPRGAAGGAGARGGGRAGGGGGAGGAS